MSSVVQVTDEPKNGGAYDVIANIPASNYASICKTLNCNEGEVGARLLQRILIETEQREYNEALKIVGLVRGAGKLAEFNALFGESSSLHYLTVQPEIIQPESIIK